MFGQTKYESFRRTYPEFVYDCYHYDVQSDGLHIVFTFRIGDSILFSPTAFIPNRSFLNFDQPKDILDTLVFNIGMIELVSYWKCFCPPKVTVKCGTLSDSQIRFWKKIYFNGLGEFFYINGIHATIEDFIKIECLNVSMPECEKVEIRISNFEFQISKLLKQSSKLLGPHRGRQRLSCYARAAQLA